MREVEKNRSVLAKSRRGTYELGGLEAPVPVPAATHTDEAAGTTQAYDPTQELTAEQIQVFERENQDMVKHYESTLDQVRFVTPQPA